MKEILVFYTFGPFYTAITTATIFASYYFILKAVRESQRRITSNTVSNRQEHRRQTRLAKKVLLLILIYMAVVTLSHVFVTFSVLASTKIIRLSQEMKANMFLASVAVVSLNSCVNPVAYSRKDPEFKATSKRLFGRLNRWLNFQITAFPTNVHAE